MDPDEEGLISMLNEQRWQLPDGFELARWEMTPAMLEDVLTTASVSMFYEEPCVGYGNRELSLMDVEALREISWAYSVVYDVDDWVSIAAHMARHFFKSGLKSSYKSASG